MLTHQARRALWPQVSKQFEQVFLLDLPPSVLSSALSDVDKIQKLEKASGMARSDIKSFKVKDQVQEGRS